MPHENDLQRRDLIADITRQLALLSTPDLRVFDRVLVVMERRRGNPGAQPHDALVAALQEVAADLDAEDRDTAARQDAARDEMVPPACTGVTASWCPRCGDCSCAKDGHDELNSPRCPLHAPSSPHAEPTPEAEFAPDQHRTRLDTTPAVIALCEQPRDRDEDLEVDLLFDSSDVDEPLRVHAPCGGREVG